MINLRMSKRVMVALSGLLIVVSSLFAGEKGIKMITEDFPPLNYLENKQLKGPSVEIVEKIKQKLNIATEIKVYPWKRGYDMTEKNINTCLFSTTRTAKREKTFKWVGPLAVKKYGFFAKKSAKIKIANLNDAKKYKVGTQMGGASEDFLKSSGFDKIDLGVEPKKSYQKLNAGRFDLWYTSSTTPVVLAKSLGVDVNEIEMVYVTKESELYMAFNKGTSDAVISNWQKAYDEIHKDGTIEKIFKKYNLENSYPK